MTRSPARKRRAKPAAIAAQVVEQWPDAVMIANRSGVIEYVNPAFEALTGFSRAEVLGRTPAILKSGAQGAAFYRRLWRELLAGRPFRGVFLNRAKSGRLFHEEEVIRPLRGRRGRIAYFVSAGRDVSARMRQLEKLQHDASHDALTGLPNRALFADRAMYAAKRAGGNRCRFARGN